MTKLYTLPSEFFCINMTYELMAITAYHAKRNLNLCCDISKQMTLSIHALKVTMNSNTACYWINIFNKSI